MRKKNNIPSAFDDVLTGLGYDNPEGSGDVTNMDQQDTFVDVEPPVEEPGIDKEPVEDKKPEEKVDTVKTDTTDIPDEVLARMNGQEVNNEPDNIDDNVVDEPSDADVTEAQ